MTRNTASDDSTDTQDITQIAAERYDFDELSLGDLRGWNVLAEDDDVIAVEDEFVQLVESVDERREHQRVFESRFGNVPTLGNGPVVVIAKLDN
jgi:hypothetical protein